MKDNADSFCFGLDFIATFLLSFNLVSMSFVILAKFINALLNNHHKGTYTICQYANYGCKKEINYYKIKDHEDTCPFKYLFTCPFCLKWRGCAEDLKSHLVDYEEETFLNDAQDFSLALKQHGIEFFKIMEELYVLLYNYNITSGLFRFSIKYVGPSDQIERRYFIFTVRHNNCGYRVRKQVDYVNNWEINKNYASTFKFDLIPKHDPLIHLNIYVRVPVLSRDIQLSMLEDLKCFTCKNLLYPSIMLNMYGYGICNQCNKKYGPFSKLRNFALDSIWNGLKKFINENGETLSEELISGFECPVCQILMCPPIKMCITGHSVCNYCESMLNGTCPICREEINDIRNYSLESICSKVNYKCIYADIGCAYASLPKDILVHENKCDYRFNDYSFK